MTEKSEKWTILFVVIKFGVLGLFLPSGLEASCSNNGGVGKVECILLARYNATQWATCVSDSYIRQKSKGRHGCYEGINTHCLYQCMLEIHDSNSGDVSSPCGCSATAAESIADQRLQLPRWCFSPTGTECNWYKTCLNRRFRCDESLFSSEIVAFAQRFCELFLNAYTRFTPPGELWLNGVRKCFLVSLVPRLRHWQQEENCEDLATHAITSFSDCFVAPFPRIPSICHVPLRDLWGVFWHMRQTLPKSSQRGLEEMIRIIENCTQFQRENLIEGKVRKVVFQHSLSGPSARRDIRLIKYGEDEKLSKAVGDEIATKFLFKEKGISWFAYSDPSTTTDVQPSGKIAFIFADGSEYKLSQRSPNSKPLVNLNHTVSKLVVSVRRNTLLLRTFDSRQRRAITGITVCRNFACRGHDSWNSTALSLTFRGFSGRVVHPFLYSYPLAFFFIYNVTLK